MEARRPSTQPASRPTLEWLDDDLFPEIIPHLLGRRGITGMEDVTCLALASSTWRAKTISLLLQDSYLARWLKYEMVYTPPHSWDDLGEDDESDGWYEYHKELCEDAKHCARALKTALAPLAALGIEFEALRMIAGPIENGLYGRQLGCFPCAHTKLGLFFLSYHQTVVQGAVNQLERFSGSGATYLIDSKSASLLGTRVAKLGLAREDVYAIFMTCSYLDLEYHVDDDICTECQENEQVVLEAVTAWASNVASAPRSSPGAEAGRAIESDLGAISPGRAAAGGGHSGLAEGK